MNLNKYVSITLSEIRTNVKRLVNQNDTNYINFRKILVYIIKSGAKNN